MPFVGCDGNIETALSIIKDQFEKWQSISSTQPRSPNVKDIANSACTGPSGIGKTTFGLHLRRALAQLKGTSAFDRAAQYGAKNNLFMRIAFDVYGLKSGEYRNAERSLALRFLYTLLKNTPLIIRKYPSYYDVYDTFFESSEVFNLNTILDSIAHQSPPTKYGLIQIQFDETNAVLRVEQGIQYVVNILKELQASVHRSRVMFISSLFSGTFSAALYLAVQKSASGMFPVSLTPLTAVDYELVSVSYCTVSLFQEIRMFTY